MHYVPCWSPGRQQIEKSQDPGERGGEVSVQIFPYSKQVGLWDHHGVCVRVYVSSD